ncbi:Fumarylacetoacetate hydrolase family protein [hydrothermal vent metagenome]|uniref:Fumarylacetoacetate hydrolase family protein n=1 Tax=hydrothermal vent metagenome TaxID=652676 RepID=A0A3B0SAJ3_9ZZZZ
MLIGAGALSWQLFKPLDHEPVPAKFTCLNLGEGEHILSPELSGRVYGVGLSYAGHIKETASDFSPDIAPPIFVKAPHSILRDGGKVAVPSSQEIFAALDRLEPGLGGKLEAIYPKMPAMLDYEVELGFVLLEDVSSQQLNDDSFIPKIGFTIVNDLSARSLIFMGEGQKNRYDYWGLSKSFPGFTPLTDSLWVPSTHKPDAIPCVTLETKVNGETRQQQTTANIIYTPKQMLGFITDKYPDQPLRKGDMIATGTPAGVIMSTPVWLVRLSSILDLGRFAKLDAVIDRKGFLTAGDKVVTSGEGLGGFSVVLE